MGTTHRRVAYAALAIAALSTTLAAAAARAQASIPPGEFAARRDSLAARLDSGVVVAFGGRTPVTDFGPFFQLPAFHYLTNFDEPDAAFAMVVRGGRGTSTLFVAPIAPRTSLYYGQRPDSAAAQAMTGIAARPTSALAATVDSLVASGLPLYSVGDYADADFAAQDSLTRGQQFVRALKARTPGLVVRDAYPLVDALRARKSAAEVALLRRAAAISDEGHRAAMRVAAPGLHEYDLQAEAERAFVRGGAARPAYGSIVGTGANGTQLHYMRNRAELKAGDLVVMDMAAEYEGYAADVTRTIPVSGTFTPAQRAIYQLVRDAQSAAERNAGPGKSARAAGDSSLAVRARGLAALGLIDSAAATIDPPWQANCETTPASCLQATLFTIHGISHGLGLAVHDPAQFYDGDRRYKPGDALTIEPGIYISTRVLDLLPDTPRNRAFVARVRPIVKRYENTGVRIEDDYLVTPTGLERLSKAPREIKEIEALMKKRTSRPIA
jgi:Xaa-Pro aminopeptidase